jgi:hypothetical protein
VSFFGKSGNWKNAFKDAKSRAGRIRAAWKDCRACSLSSATLIRVELAVEHVTGRADRRAFADVFIENNGSARANRSPAQRLLAKRVTAGNKACTGCQRQSNFLDMHMGSLLL